MLCCTNIEEVVQSISPTSKRGSWLRHCYSSLKFRNPETHRLEFYVQSATWYLSTVVSMSLVESLRWICGKSLTSYRDLVVQVIRAFLTSFSLAKKHERQARKMSELYVSIHLLTFTYEIQNTR